MKRGLKNIGFIILLCMTVLGLSSCNELNFSESLSAGPTPPEPPTPEPPTPEPPVVSPQLDVLVVIDNSLSMSSKLLAMEEKLQGFTKELGGLDWRLGITTVDSREHESSFFDSGDAPISTPGGFGGKLVSFDGNRKFISSGDSDAEKKILSQLNRYDEAFCGSVEEDSGDYDYIDHLEDDSGGEVFCSSSEPEPLKVITQFVDQLDDANSGFLRSRARLAIVIITDSDEIAPEHFHHEIYEDERASWDESLSFPVTEPSAVVSKLRRAFSFKDFAVYGIVAEESDFHLVTGDDEDAAISGEHDLQMAGCQPNWSGIRSVRVGRLVKLTNGRQQSICDKNYLEVFRQIRSAQQ